MQKNEIIKRLEGKHRKATLEMISKLKLIKMLPNDLTKEPTISNIDNKTKVLGVFAWVSFSRPYSHEKTGYKPWEIFEKFERDGWEIVPATLCKWNGYRPSPEPGTNIPDDKGHGYTLTKKWDIGHTWLDLGMVKHPRTQARCYLCKFGRIIQLSVELQSYNVYRTQFNEEMLRHPKSHKEAAYYQDHIQKDMKPSEFIRKITEVKDQEDVPF